MMSQKECYDYEAWGIQKEIPYHKQHGISFRVKNCNNGIGIKTIYPHEIEYCCWEHYQLELMEIKLRRWKYEYRYAFGKDPDDSPYLMEVDMTKRIEQ